MSIFNTKGEEPHSRLKSANISGVASSEGSYEYEDEVDESGADSGRLGVRNKRKNRVSNIIYNRFPKLVSVDENSHIAGGTTDRIN